MTPDLKTLERKLADVRQEVRNLVVMGMAPDQSPEQVALIKKTGKLGAGGSEAQDIDARILEARANDAKKLIRDDGTRA